MPYFRIAGYVLLIVSACHFAGHILLVPYFQLAHTSAGSSPGEKQLVELMNEYQRNVGGRALTAMDIQNGLSLCYGLFFLWTGLWTILMYKPIRRNHRLLARISLLNAVVLILGGLVSVFYFFWIPMTGFFLAAALFLLAWITFSRSRQF